MDRLPGLAFSVSYTTRPKREEEVEGVDYSHVTRERFQELIEQGEFVENVTYSGHQYGTSRSQIETVLRRGDDLVLNVDVEGARLLQQNGLSEQCTVVYIFVATSSPQHLEERLRSRGTESEKRIRARLEVAAQEMELLPIFDYLVVNDEFEEAVDELRAIIVAERSRVVEDHESGD
jgi:guanylate kinase